MKEIKLTQGKTVAVDDEDFKWLNKWKWYCIKIKKKHNTIYYATRNSCKNENNKSYTIFMHRQILRLEKGNKMETDHVDGNGLNNQKYNLRMATSSQNKMNRIVYKINPKSKYSSIYKGVCCITNNKFRANININGKYSIIGYFDNEIGAAIAYNKKALKLFGEFAKLNVIDYNNIEKVNIIPIDIKGGDIMYRYTETVALNVDLNMKKELVKLAKEDDRTISYIVRKIIEKYLTEKENL